MKAVPYSLVDAFTVSRPGLACDIDESLSDTVVYWMEHLSGVFGNPEKLTPRELVQKYGFSYNVPYWTERLDYWPTVEPLWHDNSFQRRLPLLPGAAEAMKLIHAKIGIACYATTRPMTVEAGTIDWIRVHRLPEADLVMRPEGIGFKEADQAKVEAVVKMYPLVSGLIDDKGSVVSLFPSNYKGTIYHIGADAPIRSDVRVVACKTWESLAREIDRLRAIPLAP